MRWMIPGALLAAGFCHAADGSAVAHVGGQSIDRADLNTRAAAALTEEQQEYEQSLTQLKRRFDRRQQAVLETELNKLIDERTLALEAAARKTTVEDLKAKIKVDSIGPEQTKAFYDANKANIREPYEQIEPKIRGYLQSQATETAQQNYLKQLRAKYHASLELEPLREPAPTDGPARGPANAPITLVEFSDFQCPYCGRYAPVIKQVMEQYPGKIRFVYHHLPLTGLHPHAQKAAEAAVCAERQGKFWEMYDAMFADQSALAVEQLKEKAKRIGLDAAAFDACLDGGQATGAVATDVKAAKDLGIGGTPASFVNGRFVDGAVNAGELSALIEDELGRHAPAAHR